MRIAGEGNRTPVCSLGSCRSTIELHPQWNFRFSIADFRFASHQLSLPRNHVAGTREIASSTRLVGKARSRSSASQDSVLTKRPADDAYWYSDIRIRRSRSGVSCCQIRISWGDYDVVVVAINGYVVG